MNDSSAEPSILGHYQTTLANLERSVARLQRRQAGTLVAALVGVIAFAGLLYLALPIISAAFLIAASWAIREFVLVRAEALHVAHLCSFYERGRERLEGTWAGKGNAGIEFARAHHLYQDDLSILGDGSLFELLCTTRSQAGSHRLAALLLDPPILQESRARQEAVRELKNLPELREQIATLSKYQSQECDGAYLREWIGVPIIEAGRMVPTFLLGSSLTCLICCLLCLAQLVPWGLLVPWVLPLLLAQAVVGLTFMGRIRPRLKHLLLLANEVAVLREGFVLMQDQEFTCAKLRSLVRSVASGEASLRIGEIERLARAVEHRAKDFFYVPSLLLAAGTQLTLAVDRWRKQNGEDFLLWLDAWAEFDALNALACYAYEHPRDIFPELLDGAARMEAISLCHPLLSANRCTGNDVSLNDGTKFYLISGSNMAGKSTFLRTIGLNAVLASAGAPVRAGSASLSVFRVCASLSIVDSLQEGKSKFLAEIERLRETIRSAEKGGPVLFLIDEILSGTNSSDRRIAAQAVIETLIKAGAIGALSTHDLALTDIANSPQSGGRNVHMQSENPNAPLEFDFRVKPGILRQTNGLAIVKMIGIKIDREVASL